MSSTDLAVILGLSPYRSEWDLAAEKLGTADPIEQTLPMRIGLALEPLIREEYERQTGERLRRVRTLARHPSIEWAVASPDYTVVGKPWLVEAKWSLARRWNDGLPQDVEAQVMWAMGVTGRRRADVAALLGGTRLEVIPVEYDDDLFEGLLEVAADFRLRLLQGGPFSETLDSLKRRYPSDDGTELGGRRRDGRGGRHAARRARPAQASLKADDERLEALIKARMAEATTLVGPGWRIHWKQTKEVATVDWKSVADGLLRTIPEPERTALVGIATTVRPGFRPFRVVREGGSE